MATMRWFATFGSSVCQPVRPPPQERCSLRPRIQGHEGRPFWRFTTAHFCARFCARRTQSGGGSQALAVPHPLVDLLNYKMRVPVKICGWDLESEGPGTFRRRVHLSLPLGPLAAGTEEGLVDAGGGD